jgi:septation ring formation regulator EzrA
MLLSLVERLKTSEANLAILSKVDQNISKFEKEKEADAKHIADLEYALSVHVELHKSEVAGLEKKLDEVTENFNVEQSKLEISDTEWSRVQKNVEELHQAKEEFYTVAMQCSDKLKMLLLVLAHSRLSEILSVVISRMWSNRLRVKSKHLMKFYLAGGIFVLV